MIDKVEDNLVTCDFQETETQDSADSTIEKLDECHQYLEITSCQVQAEIRATFERLINALQAREKQLLRQVDVFQSRHISLLQSKVGKCDEPSSLSTVPDIEVCLDDEQALVERVMSFGKVTVKGDTYNVLDQFSDVYRIEEYQNVKEDHMNLLKSVSQSEGSEGTIKFVLAPSSKCINLCKNKESTNRTPSTPQSEVEISLKGGNHTPPINDWLQKIKVETETEPTVGEVEKTISPQEELSHL